MKTIEENEIFRVLAKNEFFLAEGINYRGVYCLKNHASHFSISQFSTFPGSEEVSVFILSKETFSQTDALEKLLSVAGHSLSYED